MPEEPSVEERRLVVIPRLGGREGSDWYPWLVHELRRREFPFTQVVVHEPSDPESPIIEERLRELDLLLGDDLRLLGNTTIVAHSLGSQEILRYLANASDEIRIERLIAVAGWWDLDGEWTSLRPWLDEPYDIASAASRIGQTDLLISDNDPFTADYRRNAREWEERLGATVHIVPGAAHFNRTVEPELLHLLLAERSRTD